MPFHGIGIRSSLAGASNVLVDTPAEFVGVVVRWADLQPAGPKDWIWPAELDAVIDQAYAMGKFVVPRIMCGFDAPAWVKSEAQTITVWPTDGNPKAPEPLPLPWDPALRRHYLRMIRRLECTLLGNTAAGTPRASVIGFVPVALPTEAGTEMPLGYGVGDPTRHAFNKAAWDTVGSEDQRRSLVQNAWDEAIFDHDELLETVDSAVAWGPVFGDAYVGAKGIIQSTDKPFARTLSMQTNLRLGQLPRPRTYRGWSTVASDVMLASMAAGYRVGFQTAGAQAVGGAVGMPVGDLPAAVGDAVRTYHAFFVETYLGAVTYNAKLVPNMNVALLANA